MGQARLQSAALLCIGALPIVYASSVTLTVNASTLVSTVDPEYISANFDWHTDEEEFPAWVNSSVLEINLTDPRLITLASAFAPAHLRIGGSEQDDVWYAVDGPCPSTVNSTFCLTMDRWDEINAFAIATGVSISFGLNAMEGRPNLTSRFNSTNLDAFLRWTAGRRNYTGLWGFTFGNELEDKAQYGPYGADALLVRGLIDKYWGDLPRAQRPHLVVNDENPDAAYWEMLLPTVGPSIDVATWHEYAGYGLNPYLAADAWNASFLALPNATAALMVSAAAKAQAQSGFKLAIGETAMAWHSGRDGVTNTYLSGPWFISQLGSLAPTHAFQCRQTLIGGYYELLNKTTLAPNPDFWTALLWKRSMGAGVLSVTSHSPDVLAYAHCAANSSSGLGVTLAVINLSADSPYTLSIAGLGPDIQAAPVPRHEWWLTPAGGDPAARDVLLNDVPLTFVDGVLSPTPPRIVNDPAVSLLVAPRSYGFVSFPTASNPC